MCTDECLYAELGIEEDYQRHSQDAAWAMEVNTRFNDLAQGVVGKRLLPQTRPDPARLYPATRKLHDVFEGWQVWHGGNAGSWWLEQTVGTPDELWALLDRVDAVDIRRFILPENWQEEKQRLKAMKIAPPPLSRLNLTGVNFGPTLSVGDIRAHLPNAVIDGQLAPFTFSRNDEQGMAAEFLRDHRQTKEKRGLVFSTAGSVNNGSRLTGMRLLMSAIQHYGRYDR